MPSPLVPVQYRSPAQHDTNYQTAVVPFTAPCPACMDECHWTATAADGAVPHCPCAITEDVA